MSSTLVIQDSAGHEYPVEGPLSIGRSSQNSIPIQEPLASRTHAVVFPNQGVLCVRDENSTNGTFVNNTRINGVTPLNVGDQIRIGSTVFKVAQASGRMRPQDAQTYAPYAAAAASNPNACPGCHQTASVTSAANAQLAMPQKPSNTLVKLMTVSAVVISILTGLMFLSLVGSALLGGSLSGALSDYGGYGGALALLSWLPVLILTPILAAMAIPPWVMRNYLARLYNQQLEDWQRAQGRWDNVLYCEQCAGVFMPGQRRLVPLEHLQAFLYQIFRERTYMGISF